MQIKRIKMAPPRRKLTEKVAQVLRQINRSRIARDFGIMDKEGDAVRKAVVRRKAAKK